MIIDRVPELPSTTAASRSYLPPDVFIENLVDMLEAATFAPMNTATAKRLHLV